jgi:hypothetical protein
MYALFQLQTTRQHAVADGYFCGTDPGLSWLVCVGPEVALAALDLRAGRTRETIMMAGQLEALEQRVRALTGG